MSYMPPAIARRDLKLPPTGKVPMRVVADAITLSDTGIICEHIQAGREKSMYPPSRTYRTGTGKAWLRVSLTPARCWTDRYVATSTTRAPRSARSRNAGPGVISTTSSRPGRTSAARSTSPVPRCLPYWILPTVAAPTSRAPGTRNWRSDRIFPGPARGH